MNICVSKIWDAVVLDVPEPGQMLDERDQIAYIDGIVTVQKNRKTNPYTPCTSLHNNFNIGFSVAQKAKNMLNKKLKAEQATLKRKHSHDV